MEAGANIARTIQGGYQAMGQGLASGITGAASAVAGAYQDKKKLDAQIKADTGFLKSFMPYLDEPIRNDIAARLEDMESDPSASPMDKAAQLHNWKSYMGQSIAHTMDMEKISTQAAYNPAAITAPASAAASYAQANLDQAKLKQIQNAPTAEAAKNAQRAGISKSIMDVLRGNSAAPAQVGPTQSATSYEKLTPDVQAMVNSSGLGAEAWNSLDESQREANLANANLPNFGLPAFKPKK